MQTLLCGLHFPDWQLSAASFSLHGPSPSARPHLPLLPHTDDLQAAPLSQLALLAATHRPLSLLHKPVVQAAFMPALQPLCRPSCGIGAPAGTTARHVRSLRSQ
jgi:hypothetical protein